MYRRDEDQSPCFGEYFEQYLNSSGLELPLPNQTIFNQYISDFVQTRSFAGIDPRDFKGWFGTETNAKWNDSSSSIVWFKQVVYTQVNRNWGGSAMYEYYEKWEDFMADFNADSPATFQGVQTSSFYIRMEVEVAFLDGFVQSVMYTIILCAIVMIFFTQNLFLVLLVCFYILIICIFGWFCAVCHVYDYFVRNCDDILHSELVFGSFGLLLHFDHLHFWMVLCSLSCIRLFCAQL